jgi:hypothetical protein
MYRFCTCGYEPMRAAKVWIKNHDDEKALEISKNLIDFLHFCSILKMYFCIHFIIRNELSWLYSDVNMLIVSLLFKLNISGINKGWSEKIIDLVVLLQASYWQNIYYVFILLTLYITCIVVLSADTTGCAEICVLSSSSLVEQHSILNLY